MFEGGCCGFDIFFHCAGEAAYGCVPDDLRDFLYRIEVSGTGDGETGFDDIDAKGFQLKGQLDLFPCVELATGYLFSVAEGGIKDVDFLVGHCYNLKKDKNYCGSHSFRKYLCLLWKGNHNLSGFTPLTRGVNEPKRTADKDFKVINYDAQPFVRHAIPADQIPRKVRKTEL